MQLSLNTTGDDELLRTSSAHLTPPVTPIGKSNDHSLDQLNAADSALVKQTITKPLRFIDDLKICRDADDKPIEFGRGVLSIVYKATSTPPAPPIGTDTPPTSPAFSNRVLAAKTPSRRDAHAALQAEALTLTRLNRTQGHENRVITFLGVEATTEALIMAAVPLELSAYVEDQADLRKKTLSTATMFDPVMGIDPFFDLSRKLIDGLAWLHNEAGLIHGDVKPFNILLKPVADDCVDDQSIFPYYPLYADFSSALDISSNEENINSKITDMYAVTVPFTAPELLKSLTTGNIAISPASDVFSLAATLIACATGDMLLYPGDRRRRQLMACDGHQILDFTRNGANGARVPRNGAVEKLVKPAVVKDPLQRISAQDWLALAAA
jgi:serine/threonine protein kinase